MTNAVNDFRLLHGGGGLCGGGGCPETQTQHDDEYLLHVWTTNAVNLPSFFPLQFAAFIYRCFLYFTAPSPAQQTET